MLGYSPDTSMTRAARKKAAAAVFQCSSASHFQSKTPLCVVSFSLHTNERVSERRRWLGKQWPYKYAGCIPRHRKMKSIALLRASTSIGLGKGPLPCFRNHLDRKSVGWEKDRYLAFAII